MSTWMLTIVFSALGCVLLGVSGEASAQARGAGVDTVMTVDVDASDAARGLFKTVVMLESRGGPMEVCFVEWTPGNHNPSGPIQNVIEFRVTDAEKRPLAWERDATHVTRLRFEAPRDAMMVRVEFTYIANQPTAISRSTDSYGKALLAGLNWNTALVYPSDADKDRTIVQASIKTPSGWGLATSLPVMGGSWRSVAPGAVPFEPVSLARLVDSPVIMGKHLRTQELAGAPGHRLHAAGRTVELSQLPAGRVAKLGRMIEQTGKVFGPFPFSRYDFLILVSDDVPGFAVEHAESAFLSMPEKSFREAETGGADDDAMTVLAHEHIHAWNGKLIVPEGLLAKNYHTPAVTSLLWVYEGLTSYYDDVIAARAGMLSWDEFLHVTAQRINGYELQTGRLWRSVEDTARAMRVLREPSAAWAEARRRQDYYGEGAVFWTEADAIIRAGTNNAKSLDDFALAFFGRQPEGRKAGEPLGGRLLTYTRKDVVDALTALHPGQDWDALIRERIETPAKQLSMPVTARLGNRMEYSNEPTALQKRDEKKNKGVNLRNALGFAVDEEGRVTAVLRGSRADRAGLGYGMKVVGVGGKQFTPEALRDAVRSSPETKKVELLVNTDGETLAKFDFEYEGGLRYPRLVQDGAKTDYLRAIVEAR